MTADRPFIFYSLPKSRTTQQLINGRKIEKTWDNISSFLNNCTTARPDNPTSISLTAYTAYNGDANPEIANKIIANTKSIFGTGQTDPIAYSYPSGVPDQQTKTEWRLATNDLQRAVEYLINGQPWHKFTFGPIELIISYDFKLIHPDTKEELPNQDLSSRIIVWLSRSCVCSPDLCFPFDKADKEFYNYLKDIDRFLPFKLEEKYLRLGRPKKNNSGHVFTKIPLVKQ
jgi:hypothetical protein